MKQAGTDKTTTEYLAILLAELDRDPGAEGGEEPPADLTGLIAQLLARHPGELASAELAAYYDQALDATEREQMQRVLAADPGALGELIALDEVARAFEAAHASGVDLSAEEAGIQAAAAAGRLAPRVVQVRTPEHDLTLHPGDVAVEEVLPAVPPSNVIPFRRLAAPVASVAALAAALYLGVFLVSGPDLPDQVASRMVLPQELDPSQVTRGGSRTSYIVGDEFVVEVDAVAGLYWAVLHATEGGAVTALVSPTMIRKGDLEDGKVRFHHLAARPLGRQALVVLLGTSDLSAEDFDRGVLAVGARSARLGPAARLDLVVAGSEYTAEDQDWKAGVVQAFVVSGPTL